MNMTFPRALGWFDLESSGWVSVLSGGEKTARVSNIGAVVLIRNSFWDMYPSAECERLVSL